MNLLVPGTVVATVAIVRVLATSTRTCSTKVTHSNGILAVDQLENVLTKKP